jgi:hypothetical protein
MGDEEKKPDAPPEPQPGFPQEKIVYAVIAIAVVILAVVLIAKFSFNVDLLNPASGEMSLAGSQVNSAGQRFGNVSQTTLSQNIKGPILKQAGSCVDQIKNNDETDIDCGGSSCPACYVGKSCSQDSDCDSGSCVNGLCFQHQGLTFGREKLKGCSRSTGDFTIGSSCNDCNKNNNETDIDCGGSSCPPCAVGNSCSQNSDCTSGTCEDNQCQAPTPTPAINCGTGLTMCSGVCVDLSIDIHNCGSCGHACPSGLRYPICIAGGCKL